MEDRNFPEAVIEIKLPSGTTRQMKVSSWLADPAQRASINRQLKGLPDLDTINDITVGGRDYHLVMRPTRYYKPFTMQLMHFSHDLYKGTDTPKNFSSRIHLTRADTGENREVLIYMNNPLRYSGETYYQGSFLRDPVTDADLGTILQVVRNPGWLTPYISCAMVGGGLLTQFMSHLIGFAKRRRAK
jgi:hypothetical protein